MKKSIEKIENKFVIKFLETGSMITEYLANEKDMTLEPVIYPVLFNIEEDAKRYLEDHGVTNEQMNDIKIEYINNTLSDKYGILVTYDDSPQVSIKNLKVKDLLDLLKNLKKYYNKYLSIEIIEIGHCTTYRLNMTVYSIMIDDEHKTVTLSNYLYADNYDDDHTISKLIDSIKDYQDYDIIINIVDSTFNTVFKDYANLCHCDYDKLRKSVYLFTLSSSVNMKI